MQVVLRRVVPVHDQFYAVLIDQVFKLLFHEADHDIDLVNPSFVELPDLPLDKRLTGDLKERFRRLQVDRHHSHAESGSQNDRPAGSRAVSKFHRFFSELHRFIQVSLFHKRFQRPVDHSKGMA